MLPPKRFELTFRISSEILVPSNHREWHIKLGEQWFSLYNCELELTFRCAYPGLAVHIQGPIIPIASLDDTSFSDDTRLKSLLNFQLYKGWFQVGVTKG
jgi:hypothetical protein